MAGPAVKGLTFRAVYVPAILDGSKTTTIRRPRAALPGAGETFRLICRYDQPPFALATVVEVRDVTADQLTEADALADGFATLPALLAALYDHARPISESLLPPVWRILRFHLT
jgi:hypothetical protein